MANASNSIMGALLGLALFTACGGSGQQADGGTQDGTATSADGTGTNATGSDTAMSGADATAGGCPTGHEACDGQDCVDLTSDPDHCGECGNACAEGDACAAGMCVSDCPIGAAECGGQCVSVDSDADHCGECDNACPAEQVCVLRSLTRQRAMILRSQGRFVQHMQKALTQMNIQLANVISDVAGETGQKILRAIVAGERDGLALARLKNSRIRASEDEIAQSLQGSWRAEHLFALKQALDAFDFCGTQLAECDAQIQAQLQALHVREDEPAQGKKRGRARNAPKFDLRTQLFQMCGVDLTRIDGIDVTTALVVLSEVGADMSKFPSDKHFASWLGLCPGTKITGGKVMSGKTKRCANRAAQALRLAAAALRSSQSALGAYYRRMCARMDKPKAVTAAAHKLARLIYAMLTRGQEYTDQGQDYFEERYRQRVLHNLAQKAKAMGMQLVPSDNLT